MASRADKDAGGGLGEAAPHYLGHRERARERFLAIGGDALADYELMELALQILLPRRDTKPLAKQLLATFGSVSGVLGADPARLAEIKGLGVNSIAGLKVMQSLGQRLARERISSDAPVLIGRR